MIKPRKINVQKNYVEESELFKKFKFKKFKKNYSPARWAELGLKTIYSLEVWAKPRK